MNTKSLIALVLTVFILTSCGNRRGPTGGKVDDERPEVVSIIPENYSELTGQEIEITFTKPMDRASVYTGEQGVHIFPHINDKRFRWTDNTLRIEINETLPEDKNYYISLSDNIRDLRNNQLDRNYRFVFHTGTLSQNKISGRVFYEIPEDKGKPVTITMMTADSLRIFTQKVSGDHFSIEDLNSGPYVLRAFIDKNNNHRYNAGTEPFDQFNIPTLPFTETVINLVYADETKPEILSARAENEHLLTVVFNKPIEIITGIEIVSADSLAQSLAITAYDIIAERVEFYTAAMDSLKYELHLGEAEDKKDNIAVELKTEFQGSTEKDDTTPRVEELSPRNGSVVNTLRPVLEITFSKYIPPENLRYELVDTLTNTIVPVNRVILTSRRFVFIPERDLESRKSYMLLIKSSTSDLSGNNLEEDVKLNFIPIIRES